MAVLVMNMESTLSITLLVASRLVPGGMDMVQNTVPVSSSGIRPVRVFIAVMPRMAMATMTVMPAMTLCSMMRRTPFL